MYTLSKNGDGGSNSDINTKSPRKLYHDLDNGEFEDEKKEKKKPKKKQKQKIQLDDDTSAFFEKPPDLQTRTENPYPDMSQL